MPYDNPNMAAGQGYANMDMSKILEKIDEVLLFNKKFNDISMKICQSMGYNGLKRKHRRNVRYYTNCHLDHENESFDKYRTVLMVDTPTVQYKPSDIIDHLKKWDMQLAEDIKTLGMLNNAYRAISGKDNCIIDSAMSHMAKNYEKTGRWYARFMETKSAHDMHDLDDAIHAKEKAKEEIEMQGMYHY